MRNRSGSRLGIFISKGTNELIQAEKDTLHITGSFEGGNPQDPESIVLTDKDTFLVQPFSEDGDPIYKFRLDLKAVSNSDEQQRVNLRICWKDEEYAKYRTRLFANSGNSDWECHEGRIEGDTVVFELNLSVAETHLTLNPKYDYQDYLAMVDRAGQSSEISNRLITRTDEGRDVRLLTTPEKNADLRILMTARTHPYETAGSYCLEAIVEEILGQKTDFLRGVQLFVIPMLCPDGVSNGLCKLSRVGGEDMARSENTNDGLVSSLFSVIDEIRPHFILDFHNWMLPDRNGIFYENPRWMRRFARSVDRCGHGDREWTLGVHRKFFAKRPQGMKAYAKSHYGTRCMTIEYPWFGRSVKEMKKLGIDTAKTLVQMLTR